MSFRVIKNRACYQDQSVYDGQGDLILLAANAKTALLLVDPAQAVADNILMIDRTGRVLWRIAHPFGSAAVFVDAQQIEGGWHAYREDGLRYEFDPAAGRVDVHSARLVA